MGDGHVDVIHHVGQHEQWHPGGFDRHEVVHGRARELHGPPDHVVDDGDPLVGGAEPEGVALAGHRTITTEPVVAGRLDAVLLVAGVYLVTGAVAGVEPAAVPQGVDGLVVPGGALRLAEGTLVGVHRQPVHGRDDPVHPLLATPL